MSLTIQIISSIYSVGYGLFLGVVYNINYKFLFNKRKVTKIVFNFIFVMDLVLIYFLFLKRINQGIIHPYFYLLIILGFSITFKKFKFLRKIKFNLLKKTIKKCKKD